MFWRCYWKVHVIDPTINALCQIYHLSPGLRSVEVLHVWTVEAVDLCVCMWNKLRAERWFAQVLPLIVVFNPVSDSSNTWATSLFTWQHHAGVCHAEDRQKNTHTYYLLDALHFSVIQTIFSANKQNYHFGRKSAPTHTPTHTPISGRSGFDGLQRRKSTLQWG